MLNKGQTFSFDFLIALTIFLISFSLLMLFWNFTNLQISEKRRLEDLTDSALSLSEIFFIEGVPEYWSRENVRVIGLSNKNRINYTKLSFLSKMGYEDVKKKLNFNFNFAFVLRNESSMIYFFGLNPNEASNAVKVERIGILNSSPIIIEVIVWE